MTQMRHLLSDDSMAALQAVKFASPDPEAVTNMTREQFHLHLDIRSRMGADEDEIAEKCAVWASARDAHELMKRVRS